MIRKFKKKFAQKKAFTLIELIVVIAIIGVLAAILIPTMNGFVDQARQATATANARTVYSIATAQLTFTTLNGGEVSSTTTYTDADTEGYGKDVKDQVGTINGTYTIKISGTAVTEVKFTSTDGAVGTYPAPATTP